MSDEKHSIREAFESEFQFDSVEWNGRLCRYTLRDSPMVAPDQINDLWDAYHSGAQYQQEPTHYALIDDRGEIVSAFGLSVWPDAETICQRQKDEIFGEMSEGWTIKGITVPQS